MSVEYIGGILLHKGYWDCECDSSDGSYCHINPVGESHCNICDAEEENQPHSRAIEVSNMLRADLLGSGADASLLEEYTELERELILTEEQPS